MRLTLIAALTWPGRVIGKQNSIPWRLSEDLKRFKALTLGHPVIMGRKTWESLPFKLPGRSNIVVSRGKLVGLSPKGEAADAVAGSLDEALAAALPGGEEAFCIGGAQLYAAALGKAQALRLTLIHHPFEGDALFPPFEPVQWREISRTLQHHEGAPAFDYEFLDLIK